MGWSEPDKPLLGGGLSVQSGDIGLVGTGSVKKHSWCVRTCTIPFCHTHTPFYLFSKNCTMDPLPLQVPKELPGFDQPGTLELAFPALLPFFSPTQFARRGKKKRRSEDQPLLGFSFHIFTHFFDAHRQHSPKKMKLPFSYRSDWPLL